MGYFTEGMMIARMAEVVVKRRKPEDTAMGLLDEMLGDLGLPGAEFADCEDSDPDHPLGALLKEAFAPDVVFDEDDDGEGFYEQVTRPFKKKYDL